MTPREAASAARAVSDVRSAVAGLLHLGMAT